MNNRRPPSRMPPPPLPPTRSRSVTSKSSSSTHTTSEEQQPHKYSDTPDTNIQVIIRCRRRSKREIQDNSPIIVTSNGARSNQVSIETTAPVSTLGVVTLPPVRTYPFDLVYGPEADQSLIYHDVVSPMLEQVLEGYNCTLFAYGQTGSGKTYTMHGDLIPTPMGNPSSHAGMIPRVLFRLFHQLEQSKVDFSVRVSYIELYNEELRDLLASELAAPVGSTQPMGQGSSKDASKNTGNNIKIFDDASKRGVIIQGIEEVPVKSSKDALALLTRGSERRQIAATNINDHSSRSHSIFSLTVHTKETGVVGEDLLKVGKLNMVDLAGSENIGRSGAENKRAREAGMINQSLLTLGRVINALVDKAQHVPYRESKLTRILQDSLGGRTKTSIIATVSPARSNLEETLSTLDYAMSARSIRNKPEINQRMTRNSLLKEYVAEIERLKADVLAAREKNGIFFSEETWAEMDQEREMRETEIEETKKQVEIIENQMRVVREEFEQSIALLMKRDEELQDTKQRLNDTETELTERSEELKGVKVALEEEVVVRRAHQDTESNLDSVATELKGVAKESIHDVSALFQKLERKTAVLGSNSKAVLKYAQALSTTSKSLTNTLGDFISSSSQRTQQLCESAESFKAKETKALETYSNRVSEQLRNVQNTMQTIRTQDGNEAEAITSLETMLKDTHETFNTGFGLWAESLQKACKQTHDEMNRASTQTFSEAHSAVKGIHDILEHLVTETTSFLAREQESLTQAHTLITKTTDSEISRLREQNHALLALVERQKVDANKAKDELLQRVSGLLGDFVNAQDRGLREAVGGIMQGNEVAEGGMKVLNQQHPQVILGVERDSKEMMGVVEQARHDAKKTKDNSLQLLKDAKTSMQGRLRDNAQTITQSVQGFSAEIQQQTLQMSDVSNDAFGRHSRAKRTRLDNTERLDDDLQSHFGSLHRGLGTVTEDVRNFADQTKAHSSALADLTSAYQTANKSQLSTIQKSTIALSEQGTKEDVSTGTTPRKRSWRYVDEWNLTEDRQTLVSTWRSKGLPTVDSETLLAEHMPLPDDEEREDKDLVREPDTRADAMDVDFESLPISTPPPPPQSQSPALSEPEQIVVTAPAADPSKMTIMTTTTTTIPAPAPVPHARHTRQQSIPALKKGSGNGKGLPSQQPHVPLADTRNVYTTRGSRRRG